MPREMTRCDYCGKELGYLFVYERNALRRQHFKVEHPDEYAEIVNAAQALRKLKEKYCAPWVISHI